MKSNWINAAWRRTATGVIMLGLVTTAVGCRSGAIPAAGGQSTAASAATAPATTASAATAPTTTAPATTAPAATAAEPPATVPSSTEAPSARPSTAEALPTLGLVWGPGGQQGYGTVRPATVFNGGDPTGLVRHITWSSWGGATATGRGEAEWVAPGQTVAQGIFQPATIVAFDLGSCGGHPAYQAVEAFFPQHGGKFSSVTYINDCTGQYVGNH